MLLPFVSATDEEALLLEAAADGLACQLEDMLRLERNLISPQFSN